MVDFCVKTGEMKNIDLTWITQISFGSTIIFPNSVVIKISPCWGTRETNRQRETEKRTFEGEEGLRIEPSLFL